MQPESPAISEASSSPNKASLLFSFTAGLLLLLMAYLSGGAAMRESVTVDEVSHIGAGVSYLQKFDLRMNPEHPPLPKILAAVPLVLRGAHADYSSISWTSSDSFFQGFMGQWPFGAWFLTKWNDPEQTLDWARLPMLLLTLLLGWVSIVIARRLGGNWGGLLSLTLFVSMPAFLAFGPIVHTDIAITLFSLLAVWKLADVWANPSPRNALLFGLSFAGALVSKFTAGILLFVILAVALSMRWPPVEGQPAEKAEALAWRKVRWRSTRIGVLWAALAVYVFYFVFSLGQSSKIFYYNGHGPIAAILRRLLMPVLLYLRGVLFVVFTSNRPTFVLGHGYSHGVWFYFPVVFALKTSLGCLGLLLLAAALALWNKNRATRNPTYAVIPSDLRIHWRVLWISFLVFLGFCLLSRLTISIRHFSVPLILLILMAAPLPRLLSLLRATSPALGRVVTGVAWALALSCLVTAVRAYPFYFPYINPLSFGHPAYELVNDSNVDWNQSLPEVKKYIERRQLPKILLTQYGFADMPANLSAEAEFWDCQQPSPADGGRWAVVSANMILDGHNCVWLMQYPHESIAGGSMYGFHLPATIPDAGAAGGPPQPPAFRYFGGAPTDIQPIFLKVIQHPEQLPAVMAKMQADYAKSREQKAHPSAQPAH